MKNTNFMKNKIKIKFVQSEPSGKPIRTFKHDFVIAGDGSNSRYVLTIGGHSYSVLEDGTIQYKISGNSIEPPKE